MGPRELSEGRAEGNYLEYRLKKEKSDIYWSDIGWIQIYGPAPDIQFFKKKGKKNQRTWDHNFAAGSNVDIQANKEKKETIGWTDQIHASEFTRANSHEADDHQSANGSSPHQQSELNWKAPHSRID